MSQDDNIDINAMDYYLIDGNGNVNNNYSNANNFDNFNNLNNNFNNNLNNNIGNNNVQHYRTCPCNKCISKFSQCNTCGGFFLTKDYTEKHKNFCLKLNAIYKEKTELIVCLECKLLVKFSEYSQHVQNCSSTNFKNQKMDCQHCKKTFTLDLIEEHEVACAKVQTDMMLLKETSDCSFCKEKVSLLHIESHEKSCKKIKENQDKIDKLLTNSDIKLPDNWEKGNPKAKRISSKIYMVPIDPNSEEFFKIQEMFLYTLQDERFNIATVYRIQNVNIWEKHYREKMRIKQEKNFVEEKMLFFGNNLIQADYICKNGFDISFAADNASYGRGIYFKLRCDKVINDGYRVNKHDATLFIFVANVLVGIPHVQPIVDTTMRKPPFYDKDRFIYYDSVTNVDNFSNLKDVDQTYVVYNNEKAYPLYMIEYYHSNRIY